jgi:RNA-directed DNA polymerase
MHWASIEFTFLGYTFRPRYERDRHGGWGTGFLPAVSKAAMTSMAAVIRAWNLGRATNLTLGGLATYVNRVVVGWINYYGRFYKSRLIAFLQERLNPHLVKWAQRKFKHLHRSPAKARKRLARIAERDPHLFVHWRHGALPSA